jgi:hypothetical protein
VEKPLQQIAPVWNPNCLAQRPLPQGEESIPSPPNGPIHALSWNTHNQRAKLFHRAEAGSIENIVCRRYATFLNAQAVPEVM